MPSDDEYLKAPVNFMEKLPVKFYEKIQTHGNQTLKRPIFVELKKGGELFNIIHTSDIYKHRQSKPVLLILDIIFSSLEKSGERTKWGEEKKS